MQRPEIAAEIRGFLEQEFPSSDEPLTDATNLLEDWFMDSFGIISTVMFLEDTFAIKIDRADINGINFENVAALTAMVATRMAAA